MLRQTHVVLNIGDYFFKEPVLRDIKEGSKVESIDRCPLEFKKNVFVNRRGYYNIHVRRPAIYFLILHQAF
jgi:hypothetical protein